MRWLTAPLIAALTMTFLIVGGQPAAADTCPRGTTPAAGEGLICIPVSIPGHEADGSDGDSNASTGPRVCRTDDHKIPCTWAGGTWSQSHGCYLIPTIQPPADSEIWQGNDPKRGRVYVCDQRVPGTPTYVYIVGGGVPDPGTLAQSALEQLALTVPELKTAPLTTGMTYVGLRTWLWIPSSQWSTLRRSVTVGNTTVTVTAEPRRVRWNLGTGSTTCNGPGRAWAIGQMDESDTTTCGYTYRRVSDFETGDEFEVRAMISFRVDWVCSGECLQNEGSLGDVDGLPGQTSVRVGERQSVNTTTPRGT